MALTPTTITAALRAAAPEFLGPSFNPLSVAIGTAIYNWAIVPSNVYLVGQTSGIAGSGVASGLLTVPQNPPAAVAAFAANGVTGPNGVGLARAVGVGIPTAFGSAQYSGLSVGVSAGSDISKVVLANPATLVGFLLSYMQPNFAGALGPSAPQLALAIASAVSSLLLAGFTTPGTGIVASVAPAPGPAVGVSPLSAVF